MDGQTEETPCGSSAYLGEKMIRNLEGSSPLNLIKIGNGAFRESRTKVCLLNIHYFINPGIFRASFPEKE